MAPLATADAQRELAVLTDLLTAVRTDHGDLPQHRLASMVGVSTNSVIDWESGQESLTLRHLIAWAHSLALRLVIVDALGAQIRYPLTRDNTEAWDVYELRRLTGALRDVREGSLGMTQLEVAHKAGISRSSIRHWEVLTTPPRTIGFIRWTMALGCRIRLAQMRPPHRILSPAERPGLPTADPDHCNP